MLLNNPSIQKGPKISQLLNESTNQSPLANLPRDGLIQLAITTLLSDCKSFDRWLTHHSSAIRLKTSALTLPGEIVNLPKQENVKASLIQNSEASFLVLYTGSFPSGNEGRQPKQTTIPCPIQLRVSLYSPNHKITKLRKGSFIKSQRIFNSDQTCQAIESKNKPNTKHKLKINFSGQVNHSVGSNILSLRFFLL